MAFKQNSVGEEIQADASALVYLLSHERIFLVRQSALGGRGSTGYSFSIPKKNKRVPVARKDTLNVSK